MLGQNFKRPTIKEASLGFGLCEHNKNAKGGRGEGTESDAIPSLPGVKGGNVNELVSRTTGLG